MTVKYFIYRAKGMYCYMITVGFQVPEKTFRDHPGVKCVSSGVLLYNDSDRKSIDEMAWVVQEVIDEANEKSRFSPKVLEDRLNSVQNL